MGFLTIKNGPFCESESGFFMNRQNRILYGSFSKKYWESLENTGKHENTGKYWKIPFRESTFCKTTSGNAFK